MLELSAEQMNVAREWKSRVLGVIGLTRQLFSRRWKSQQSGEDVILLSMGGRFGSPMLAGVLIRMGFTVHVISQKMPGHEISVGARWHRCNCLGEYDKLRARIESISPSGIFSEGRNVLIPIKARLLEELGFRGFGRLSPATSSSKIEFRTALDDAEVENLQWQVFEGVESIVMDLPFVLKPDRGTGSRGVYLLRSDAELREAVCQIDALEDTQIYGGVRILEEYVFGRQFDVEGVSRDGDAYPLSLTEEQYEEFDGHFPSLWYLFNPPVDENLRSRLIECAVQTVKAAGVINGAWHCELRISEDGRISPIDYSNRMGYPKMVSEASGVDFLRLYVETLLDKPFVPPTPGRATVFQHFVGTSEQRSRYQRLVKENSSQLIEFREKNIKLPGVTRYGRISLRAKNFGDLYRLLGKYDLIPPQWSSLYPDEMAQLTDA